MARQKALKWTNLVRADIHDSNAIELFGNIYALYQKTYGLPDMVVNHIINDISLLEQRKNDYNKDIGARGVMIMWENGRNQSGFREHPLLKEIPKFIEQQRRLLNEIRLTPAALKAVPVDDDVGGGRDDFDNF